jgi:hypothetical protein
MDEPKRPFPVMLIVGVIGGLLIVATIVVAFLARNLRQGNEERQRQQIEAADRTGLTVIHELNVIPPPVWLDSMRLKARGNEGALREMMDLVAAFGPANWKEQVVMDAAEPWRQLQEIARKLDLGLSLEPDLRAFLDKLHGRGDWIKGRENEWAERAGATALPNARPDLLDGYIARVKSGQILLVSGRVDGGSESLPSVDASQTNSTEFFQSGASRTIEGVVVADGTVGGAPVRLYRFSIPLEGGGTLKFIVIVSIRD